MLVVDPRFIDCVRWTAETGRNLAQYGTIPKLSLEADWKKWAGYMIDLPELSSVGVPRPDNFADWRDWAHQFNLTIRAIAQ